MMQIRQILGNEYIRKINIREINDFPKIEQFIIPLNSNIVKTNFQNDSHIRFKIRGFILENDGIPFGNVICATDKIEGITYFHQFDVYGQIRKLMDILINKIINYSRSINSRFIIGPYCPYKNLGSEYGFDTIEQAEYLQAFKNTGKFTEFIKLNTKSLVFKNL
ncbi:MAG: hypothetical protein ACTSQO_06395 [Candidatus Helarchaeota archaeon]